jgi:hypothetical protein
VLGLAIVGAFLGLKHRRRTLLSFVLVGRPGGLVEHHCPLSRQRLAA